MKKITIFIIILLILNLPILIYLANFKLMINNIDFYQKEFKKNRIYDEVSNADNVLNEILLFFKSKASLSNVFNENEKSHLQDVKNLIMGVNYVFYGSLLLEIILLFVLFLTYKKNIGYFFEIIGFSFIITGLTIVIFSLLLYIFSGSFSDLFVKFHLIVFPWGNWQFPDTSILIKTFPDYFFYDFTYKAVSNAIFTAVITTIVGIICFVPSKKIKNR